MTRYLLIAMLAFSLQPLIRGQTKEIVKEVNEKLDSLRAEDDQLRTVLANHPSVAAAKAKVMLAEAELNQIRLELTTKITAARAEIKLAEQGLRHTQDQLKILAENQRAGTVSFNEILQMRLQVTNFETNLQKTKAKLQELTLVDGNAHSMKPQATGIMLGTPENGLGTPHVVKTRPDESVIRSNPVLAGVVSKTVKMDASGLAPTLLDEVIKQAGFDGTIRFGSMKVGMFKDETLHVKHSGQMTVTAWVDLILDEVNSRIPSGNGPFDCYVREYGLLITDRKNAPADALTLREFARAVRSERGGK